MQYDYGDAVPISQFFQNQQSNFVPETHYSDVRWLTYFCPAATLVGIVARQPSILAYTHLTHWTLFGLNYFALSHEMPEAHIPVTVTALSYMLSNSLHARKGRCVSLSTLSAVVGGVTFCAHAVHSTNAMRRY
eukprot:PhM_4_TR14012/c0_g1_i1/m.64197